MRMNGFPGWTRSVVAAVENGGRRIDAEELAGLAIALNVPASYLVLSKDRWIGVGDQGAATHNAVLRIFEGERAGDLAVTAFRSPRTDQAIAEMALVSRTMRRVADLAPEVSWGRLGAAEKGELERLIAGRLDVQPIEVAAAAHHLWGRSASEERDARAEERPRAKQHISRAIAEEIRGVLAEQARGRSTEGENR